MVGPPLNPAGGSPFISGVTHGIPAAGHVDLATRYFGRQSVRDTWIALWVLWLLWALLFFVKQSFGAARVAGARQTAPVAAANNMNDVQSVHDSGTAEAIVNGPFGFALPPPVLDGNQGAGSEDINIAQPVPTTTPAAPPRRGFFDRAVENVRERVDRAYDLVRDLTLMLLLVVTVNTFGLGSGIAMLILVWVYLSVAVFWASLMMLIENRIIDMVLGSIEMLLLLAMLIAAYTIGWTVID